MATITTCHWHPDRETGLTCGNCGKPICTECMRHHQVGIRCKECAKLTRLPTFQLSSVYVLRGLGAMLGLGIAGGLALVLIDVLLPFGLFSLMIMIGLGYAIGEGLSAAVNRKRGRPLQCMAAGAVAIAVAVSVLGDLLRISSQTGIGLFDVIRVLDLSSWFNLIGLFGFIGIGLAIVVAVNRLKA
jgi:hypothetical protein